MAVAAMSRLGLYGLRQDLSAIMTLLQQAEAVEVEAAEGETSTLVDPSAIAALEREIGELERTIAFFDRVAPRRPNLIEQFAGIKTILTGAEFRSYALDTEGVRKIIERARAIESELGRISGRLHDMEVLHEQLAPWVELPLTRAELEGTRYVRIVLGEIAGDLYEPAMASLRQVEPRVIPLIVSTDLENVRIAVILPRNTELGRILEDSSLKQVTLPGYEGRIDRALAAATFEIDSLRRNSDELTKEAVDLTLQRPRVEARLDYLRGESVRLNAMRNLAETRHAFQLRGWIPNERIEDLRQVLDRSGHAYSLTTRPPEPGEDVPVVMRNTGPVVPFEALVQSFSTPKYDELDPTPITAPFFFLFFGFCLSDVGYGLVLILFCLALLRWLKMGPTGHKLARLFVFGGIGAIVMGLVTGSIFGDLLGFKGLINPIDNALTLLGLALGLGVIQLFLGIVLSALPSIKRGEWRDAFFNQLVWLLFLSSIMLLLGKSALKLGRFGSTAVNYLAILTTFGVIYNATRGKRGLVRKLLAIPAGLFNIYSSIGFFSDVLSYSRLMALGMSGGVMAMIVNLFSRLVAGAGIPGIIAAVVIGVFGHALNISLSILGAYVHSSRLQFLEFYGKFFEGGGRPFRPLRAEQKHTFVIKQREA